MKFPAYLRVCAILLLSIEQFQVSGQLAQIGSGSATSATSGPSPINNYYRSHHQQIVYSRSELNAAGINGGNIEKLGFYVVSSTSQAMPDYRIRLGHTTSRQVNPYLADPTDEVYFNSSYAPSIGGFDMLRLDSAWFWNGEDNILVDVSWDYNTYPTIATGVVRVYNDSNYRTGYIRSSSMNVANLPTTSSITSKPQIQFQFTPSASNDAGITHISPDLISCAGSHMVTATVINYGNNFLNSATLNWSVNGVVQSPAMLSTPLDTFGGAGSMTAEVNLGNYLFTTGASYNIVVWTTSPNGTSDPNTSNDSLSVVVQGAMSGTYSIGGGGADYGSFTSAVNALVNNGVCGDVTFIVASGGYFEQVVIPEIAGTGPGATITFQSTSGDSTTVVLSHSASSADNFTLFIDGADWLSFKNLTIESSNTTYDRVVMIGDETNHLDFSNCIVRNVATNSPYNYTLIEVQNNVSGGNLRFHNNRFINGYRAYYTTSSMPYLEITNNEFINQQYEGIQISNGSYISIDDNLVRTNSNSSFSAVYLINCDSLISVQRNIIRNIRGGTGIQIYYCDGSEANPILIANNYVHLNSQSNGTAIYNTNSHFIHILYNTLNVSSTLASSRGIYSSFYDVKILNNNVSTKGGYALYVTNGSGVDQSDYNNLYSEGDYLAYWEGDREDLTALQTASGMDSNSLSEPPYFLNDSSYQSAQISLNNNAMPLPSVGVDIEGEARSASTPDIGADEFAPSSTDAGVYLVIPPSIPFGAGSQPIRAVIKNFGATPLTNVTVNWMVNGSAKSAVNFTGSIASGDTAIINLGTLSMQVGDYYDFKAYTTSPNGGADAFALNDTATHSAITPGLAGVYTVGGASPDFADFASLTATLNIGGIVDSVTFNIRSGTYNERFVLSKIPRLNEDDQIMFQSEANDSSAVSISAGYLNSATNYVVRMNGSKWITFKDLKIQNTSNNSYSQVILLDSGASHISFINCSLIAGVAVSSATNVLYSYKSQNNLPGQDYIHLYGCSIRNGYYGAYFYSRNVNDSHNSVENCEITGAYAGGLYFSEQDSIRIIGNTIIPRPSANNFYGCYIQQADYGEIRMNRILGEQIRYGLYLYITTGSLADPFIVANNFIRTGGTNLGYGISVNSSSHLKVVYNSVLNSSTNTASSAYFDNYNNYSIYTGLEVWNNIFQNTGGGFAVDVNYTYAKGNSDYNNLYTSGSYVGTYGNTSLANLVDWQNATTLDSNSLSVDAQFSSTEDLHINASALDKKAMPLAYVLTDIDGEVRDLSNPDIGADEITVAGSDAGIVKYDSPLKPFAAGAQDVSVTLLNNGGDTLTNVTINWEVNGVAQTPFAWTGNLESGHTLDSVIIGFYSFVEDTLYTIKIWTSQPNGQADLLAANDTITKSNIYAALSGTYTIGGTAPDFMDFTAAVSALHTRGVSGWVTFKVRDGEYNENILIRQISGASMADSVVFESESGDSALVVVKSDVSNIPLVELRGTDHISFRNMTLYNSYYYIGDGVVVVDSGANYINFMGCTIKDSLSSTYGDYLFTSLSGYDNNYIRIINCNFLNGRYGIYNRGTSNHEKGLEVRNCVMENQYYWGMYLVNVEDLAITNNRINSQRGYTAFNGIEVNSAYGGVRITNNVLTSIGYTGLQLSSLLCQMGNPALIANNFVQTTGTYSASSGISLTYSQYVNLVYNSVNALNSQSSTEAFYEYGCSNTNVLNNIFQSQGGGLAVDIYNNYGTLNCDFNNLYTGGVDLARYRNTLVGSLASWKTTSGLDSNSVSVNSQFVDTTDLHIEAAALNGAATPLTYVMVDYDGETRDPVTPDIGADEVLLNNNDASLTAFMGPRKPFAAGAQTLYVSLLNNGADTLQSVQINWSVNGIAQTALSWTGSLATGESLDSVAVGTYSFIPITLHDLVLFTSMPNGQPDDQPSNDSVVKNDLYPALAGTYTIGGTTPDFADFNSAVFALNSGGVVGWVNFNVRDGIYTEQVTLSAVMGASASDSIVFQSESGDPMNVSLEYSGNSSLRHTLLLQDASYVSFKNLSIVGLYTTYAYVAELAGNLTGNRFIGCQIEVPISTSSVEGITGQGSFTDLRIVDCHISGGYYGIYLNGSSETGLMILNNSLVNQYVAGMYLQDFDAAHIMGNQVVTNRTYSGFTAYYLQSMNNGTQVLNNKAHTPYGSEGFYFYIMSGGANRGLIANNFATVGDSSVSLSQFTAFRFISGSNVDIFYNSANLASTNGRAFELTGISGLDVRNNIMAATGGGYALYSNSSPANFTMLDYNDYFTTGANLFNYTFSGIGEIASLNTWQTTTGLDAHSISANPLFLSDVDLHVDQSALDSAATPVASVTDDIDGQARDPQFPDIGADEVSFFSGDVAIESIIGPVSGCELSDSSQVVLKVVNNGTDPQTGFDITVVVNSDTTVVNLGVSIPGGSSINYTVPLYYDLSLIGTYTIEAWASLAGDVNPSNDSTSGSVTHFAPPSISVSADTVVCGGKVVNLTASGGTNFFWSNGLTGPSIMVAPNVTTTYTVTVTDANGCTGIDSVTVSISNSADSTYLSTSTCDSAQVGLFVSVFINQGGCDSTVYTNVVYQPNYMLSLPGLEICEGSSVDIFGMNTGIAGIYYDTLTTVNGCDSIISQGLTVHAVDTVAVGSSDICEGDSIMLFGTYQSLAGTYYNVLVSSFGCDSVLSSILNVHPVYDQYDTTRICQGDSALLAGAYRKVSGTYIESLFTTAGCDSLINHMLEVVPAFATSQGVTICEGDSILLAGIYQTMAGVYVDSLVTMGGCDSVVTTTLAVNPSYQVSVNLSINPGDSILVHGRYISAIGVYYDTLSTIKGCDSLVLVNVGQAAPVRFFSFTGNTNFVNSVVYPLQGSPYTTFDFEVTYTDSTGSMPPFGYPRLYLDYEANGIYTGANDRVVLLTAADVNDVNVVDGKNYVGSINSLPEGTNWKILVQVVDGGELINFGPFDYPDVLTEPDLQIFANDISFSNANPPVSSPLTVSAKITNSSDLPAQNFVVHLRNQYDTTAVYPDITVANLAPNSSTVVSWNITTPADPSWNPMQVTVDYTNVIQETNELDNQAVRPFTNGNYNVPGNIVIIASASPFSTCSSPGALVTVSGYAYYTNTAIALSDSSVAGAEVDFSTNSASYTTVTNSYGYFSLKVPAPLVANAYMVQGTVTDFTLTGNFSTNYVINDCPCVLPDLVAEISVSKNSIFPGEAISGTIVVKNKGCVAAGSNLLDVTQTGGIPTIADANIPTLNPGDTFMYNFSNIVFNTPGVYSICGTADGNFIIQELNEWNNTACATIRVLDPHPDIVPVSGPGNTQYICSNPVPRFVVQNQGAVATGAFVCKIRIYESGVLVDSVYQSIANLPPYTSTGFPIAYLYPSIGFYSFDIECDTTVATEGVVAESNELNNTATYYIEIIGCKPDLIIGNCGNLKVDPVDPQNPGMVTYEASVRNGGNDTAKAPIDIDFDVSSGGTHSTQILTDLAPGQSAVVSVNVPSVPPATANLMVTADPMDNIDEFHENNNSQQDSLCWEFRPMPRCGFNFWNRSYSINTLINVSVGVKVEHLYEASAVEVKFEVSGPGIAGTQDLGTYDLNNVQKNCSCPYTMALPGGFIFSNPGTYTFTFTTDPNNVYTECNENNNVFTVTVDAFDGPDMRVLSQFINFSKLNPDVNEPISLDVTYENIGIANINDQMELKILVDGIPLDSIKPVPGLVSGDNTTFSIPTSWSSSIPGAHIVRAIIDSDNEIAETNELNNEATRAIVVGEAANLFFALFEASNSSPDIGDSIVVDAIIGNNGDVDAMADVRFSYVNDMFDTIHLGTIPISVLKHDSTAIQMPWLVADNTTTLIGQIINTNTLEWTYDDNYADDSIGVFSVVLASTPSCFGQASGSIDVSVIGGIPPFTYYWNTGYTGQQLIGGPGNYFVDVSDSVGTTVRAYGKIDTVAGSLSILPSMAMCAGDSMEVFGVWRYGAGIYYDTLVSLAGCDSILKKQLLINPIIRTYQNSQICDYSLSDSSYVEMSSFGFTAVNGCDSIHTLTIVHMPVPRQSININLCAGDSLYLAGMYRTTSGTYVDTLIADSGCDSMVTYQLNISNPYVGALPSASICAGDSAQIFGVWRKMAGTYFDSLTNTQGCDSILVKHLNVNPSYQLNTNAFICTGDSIFLGGAFRNSAGTYTDTAVTARGCDSIITTNLAVGNLKLVNKQDSICQGDSLFVGGSWRHLTGTYYDTLATAGGCDSVCATHLVVNPTYDLTNHVMICEGDSIWAAGSWQHTAGNYIDVYSTVHGCDSSVTTALMVKPAYELYDSLRICTGDSAFLSGSWQTTSGWYVGMYSAVNSCDSIVHTFLTVAPTITVSQVQSICQGDSIYLEMAWRKEAGIYEDIYPLSSGCDSVVLTQLTVLPNVIHQVSVDVCAGDSTFAGGAYQNMAGVYVDILTAANGCDSLVYTTVNIKTTGCGVDCNGDPNGTAFIDSCGTCVGGNTGLQPCVPTCTRLEVVSFTLVNAATDMDVKTLVDGDTVDKRILNSFSIRANTCDSPAPPSGQVECITFDNANLAAGNVPTQVYTSSNSGPIGVYGKNPAFSGINAAMIFNSSSPTGGDPDLGTPHSDFGGPGVGAGGAAGTAHENNTSLGNVLIVSQDLDSGNPNDLRGKGEFDFDFSAIGPVSVHSLTYIDVEGKEGPPVVKFYGVGNVLIATVNLATTGDNGVETVSFGPVAGVMSMEVHLNGSGAIDNLCIEKSAIAGSGLPVGSVLFDVNGNLLTVENQAPYAIKGGSVTNYNPWNVPAGTYHIMATPYSQGNGKGVKGTAEAITMVVVDSVPQVDCNGVPGGTAYFDTCGVCVGGNTGNTPCIGGCANLEVVSFSLISATNGSNLGPLINGTVIDKALIGPFSIRANTCNGAVGSVLFDLNGSVVMKENLIPYDINGGSIIRPNAYNPAPGPYILIGLPYSNANGKGALGISETVNFTVVGIAPRMASGTGNLTEKDAQREDGLPHPAEAGSTGLSLVEAGILPFIKLYPNPTGGWLNIEVENVRGNSELMLLDNAGRRLQNIMLTEEPAERKQLYRMDLSTLPKGVYLIQLQSESGTFHKRVIRN